MQQPQQQPQQQRQQPRMPNSILKKFEQEISENRRLMMEELDECCTQRLHAAIGSGNTPENWRLYQAALVAFDRAHINKPDDDMFALLNYSSSKRKVRGSTKSTRKSSTGSM